jgi:RNA repair pathway DNA polymerase beta family
MKRVTEEPGLERWVIYRCVVGSRAFGLAEAGSDTDRRGIYLPPAARHWSLAGVPELIARKLAGPERAALPDADVELHRREYERLEGELEEAVRVTRLPDAPIARPGLNDLLVRLRLGAAP